MAADIQHTPSFENSETTPQAPKPNPAETDRAVKQIQEIRPTRKEQQVINMTVPALGEEDRRDFGDLNVRVRPARHDSAPRAPIRMKFDSEWNRVPLDGDTPPTGPDTATLWTPARPIKLRQEETGDIAPHIHQEAPKPIKENLSQSTDWNPDRDYGTYDDGTGTPQRAWKQKGGVKWKTVGKNAFIDPDRVSIQDAPPEQASSSDPENTPPESSRYTETSVGAPKTRPVTERQFTTEDLAPAEYPTSDAGNYAFKKGDTFEAPKTPPGIEEKRFTPEEQALGKYTAPDGQKWDIPPGSTGATWEKTPQGNRVTFQTQKNNETKETSSPETSNVRSKNANPSPDSTTAAESWQKETIKSQTEPSREHTPEEQSYLKKETQFQEELKNGTFTQKNEKGEVEFTENWRKAFRELVLTEHEYIPGALFSSATWGRDSMPSDPDKQEKALQAQEKQFFKNYMTHAELAQTPSETTLAMAQRIGSQEKKHLVNGGEDQISFDVSKGIVSGDDPDLSIERWRGYDYAHRKGGYPKLTVFSEQKDAGGRPMFSGTLIHPDDPKTQEIKEKLQRGGKYPNLYTTQMDVDGSGKLRDVFILPPSIRADGYAVNQSLGDVPVWPSKVVVLKEKKQNFEREGLN